jgi:transposase
VTNPACSRVSTEQEAHSRVLAMHRPVDDLTLLRRWVKAPTTPQRVVRRSRIVLLAIDGRHEADIAEAVGVTRSTVRLWITRYHQLGAQGLLHDAPGRGRHALLDPAVVRQQLALAGLLDAKGKPISVRRAAAALGVSASALWRALQKVPSEPDPSRL